MSVAQQMKTVVTLGGAVDGSFKTVGSALGKTVSQASKSVRDLKRDQSQLNREIRRAEKAGASVELLKRQYASLGEQIESAERKASAWGKVGNVAANVRRRMTQVAAVGGALVGMSGMLGGLATASAAATAEQYGLAQAYGMSIEKYKAWGGVASEVGLDADATGDLVEELTNKVGEFKALGEQSAVGEVFGALGLEAAMLEGMSAAEQFEFIIKRLEGVGDDQTAASLADILMGGEGNKIVTYMRKSGKSLDELLDRHEKFNLLTTAGATGAGEYSRSISALFGSVSSAWQEISGIVGGELAPSINEMAQSVAEFARANKTELVETLKSGISFARDFATGLWELGQGVATVVGGLADLVGGADNLVQIGGVLMVGVVGAKMVTGLMAVGGAIGGVVTAMGGLSAIMPAVAIGFKAVGVALLANPIGLAVGAIAGAATALYMNWDKVTNFVSARWQKLVGVFGKAKRWFKKLKFWGDDDESPSGPVAEPSGRADAYRESLARAEQASLTINRAAPSSGGNTVNQRVEKIEVVAAPGQSPQEVGQAVAAQLGGHHDAALYDIPMG